MWGAVLGAGLSLLDAQQKRAAAEEAKIAMENRFKETRGIQGEMYNQSKDLFDPYIGLGSWGANRLKNQMQSGEINKRYTFNDYVNSPEYKGALDEGLRAISRGRSVIGGGLSGGTLKALDQYGTNQTNKLYGEAEARNRAQNAQVYNQLQGVMGAGMQGANALANLNTNYGINLGNLSLGQGSNAANNAIYNSNVDSNLYKSLGQSGQDLINYYQNKQQQPGNGMSQSDAFGYGPAPYNPWAKNYTS